MNNLKVAELTGALRFAAAEIPAALIPSAPRRAGGLRAVINRGAISIHPRMVFIRARMIFIGARMIFIQRLMIFLQTLPIGLQRCVKFINTLLKIINTLTNFIQTLMNFIEILTIFTNTTPIFLQNSGVFGNPGMIFVRKTLTRRLEWPIFNPAPMNFVPLRSFLPIRRSFKTPRAETVPAGR